MYDTIIFLMLGEGRGGQRRGEEGRGGRGGEGRGEEGGERWGEVGRDGK